MSVFEDIMCKVDEITCRYVDALNGDLKVAFDALDAFAEEYKGGKREAAQKNKALSTLQSINEDEASDDAKTEDQEAPKEKRLSQKRGKQDVDGMSSPEQEKRQKRNASVKAQNNISKQDVQVLKTLNQNIIILSDEDDLVNVNLNQKLRRDDSTEKSSRRRKGENKENTEPLIVKVKEEKISLVPEPMETEAALDIPIKQEPNKDEIAMPPPAVPLPRSRRLQKDISTDSEDEPTGTRRTRTRKQTDTAPPSVTAERAIRSSRRGSRAEPAPAPAPAPPAPRPKRTRAKKKISESSTADTEVSSTTSEAVLGSPAEKPRPKRTRRGRKASEKEEPKPIEPTPEPEPLVSPKEERISNDQSPAIPQKTVKKTKNDTTSDDSIETSTKNNKTKTKAKAKEPITLEETAVEPKIDSKAKSNKKTPEAVNLEETQVISQMNTTVTISMDKTVVLPNGVYDNTDGNQANVMNATVVLEKMSRETLVLDKAQTIMDATVVLEKDGVMVNGAPNITDDNSLITEDDSDPPEYGTPPGAGPPEPTSAVKAKVQQFEEMATRTTRTKTRAMAKKDAESETCTPPDKIIPKQQVLSAETLAKMNNLIFNGKSAQGSVSAMKPSAKLPPVKNVSASASKISAINRAREEFEARGKDDARRKKEAMLEAKKEQQRRKREEKMAAAAAAREQAERERRAALQAAARDRLEKQAHADQGKLVRLKEVEKRKQEQARKAAETEERRRAEEQARQARLAEEQRRADAARRKQLEESEAMKKEAALIAKEIEKRQKEYLEKQKMKQRMDADKYHTPMKGMGSANIPPMEPVYMCDGFQYLDSDEDEDEDENVQKTRPKMPAPAWNASKARNHQIALQEALPTEMVDRLFSVRVHSPDLRAIFPALERRELKRTSSAVWRTPPPLPPV